jgi:diguanylate cyclase (GGDEF)-like protein
MNFSTKTKPSNNLRSAYIFPAVVSLLALVATFVTSNTNYSFETKTLIFSAIIVGYVIFAAILYVRQNRRIKKDYASRFDAEIEEKLLALEEAGKFFGSSLKPADMFRLIANRVNEIVPFTTCVFYRFDERAGVLCSAHCGGQNVEQLEAVKFESARGATGKAFTEKVSVIDGNIALEKMAIPPPKLKNLNSAASIPLKTETQSFGVLTLYGDRENAFAPHHVPLLEAVGERIAPFLLSSLTFEKNIENALTDSLTELPNERAFYLVLENQIAESQRYREQRPLTILSIDIKNFEEINKKFGHTSGDQILAYAARMIKGQLRQMDFLSRASGDEFLAVLPTANDEITKIIVERIEKAFDSSPFELTKDEREFIKLNFGTASFLKDGETAQQLLRTATLRKKEAKNPQRSTLLWFNREYVN